MSNIRDGIYLHNSCDLLIEIINQGKEYRTIDGCIYSWMQLDCSIYGWLTNKTFPEDFAYIGEV